VRATFVVLACLGALAHGAEADERKWYDRIDVSGYVDVYYAFNTNQPLSYDNFIPNTGTTAKKHNQFSLNLAAVDISMVDPVIVHLVFNFGSGTNILHAEEPTGTAIGPGVWQFIQQAYVGYKVPIGRGLTIEGGIFPSHVGIEVFPSKDNWNYTRSWMAEESPYYQAGVRVTYPFTERLSAQLLYLNGWEIIGEDNNWKTFGTQLQWAHPKVTLLLNTLIGPEQPNEHSTWRFFFDGIAQVQATRRLQLAAAFDYGFEMLPAGGFGHWYGGAVYGRVQCLGWLWVTGRVDVYHDGLGSPPGVTRVLTGVIQTLAEGTLTIEAHATDHLILKLEGRYDHSTQPVFDAHGFSMLTAQPLLTNQEGLIVLGAVGVF
jgi:hypothetical protein